MKRRRKRRNRKVLVVDDDEQILSALKRGLGRDRVVFTATNLAAARELARTERPGLAIIDVRLEQSSGDISGIELVRELKATRPPPKVALISGFISVPATVAAMRAGADVVLSKPITCREILRALDEDLDDPDPDATPSLARAEWEHIHRVLADCNGSVSEAARRLQIFRSVLQRKLKKPVPRV